jgi:hypothetical protein
LRRRLHQTSPFGERATPPRLPSKAHLAYDDEGFVPRVTVVSGARLFIGRIGGRKPRLRTRGICTKVRLVAFGEVVFFAHKLGVALLCQPSITAFETYWPSEIRRQFQFRNRRLAPLHKPMGSRDILLA